MGNLLLFKKTFIDFNCVSLYNIIDLLSAFAK